MHLFLTGTDTEVGKSVVTACLAEAAATRGSVVAAKPVASGVEAGGAGEDAELLAAAAGHAPAVFATWEPPVSPHRAILDGGTPLDRAALEAWVRSHRADTVLVEGVGGWRVPLQLEPRIDVVDLARWTEGSVVVVARDRLGVLSHTLLTVEAIRADGLPVAAVVLNRIPDPHGSAPPSSNLADLRLLLDVPVAVLPPIDPWSPADRLDAGRTLWNSLSGTGSGS